MLLSKGPKKLVTTSQARLASMGFFTEPVSTTRSPTDWTLICEEGMQLGEEVSKTREVAIDIDVERDDLLAVLVGEEDGGLRLHPSPTR